MDVCYYNEQIKEELDGAIGYIQKAMNLKKSHPEWAQLYAKMSEAELGHAGTLKKIFEDDYEKVSGSANEDTMPLLNGIHKSINDMYMEYAAKVKCMHELYNGK